MESTNVFVIMVQMDRAKDGSANSHSYVESAWTTMGAAEKHKSELEYDWKTRDYEDIYAEITVVALQVGD